MKCTLCGRSMKHPNPLGMGKICARKSLRQSEAQAAKKPRVELLSHPGNAERRIYLVFSEPQRRVTIHLNGSGKRATCECSPNETCEHITHVAEIDHIRFPLPVRTDD